MLRASASAPRAITPIPHTRRGRPLALALATRGGAHLSCVVRQDRGQVHLPRLRIVAPSNHARQAVCAKAPCASSSARPRADETFHRTLSWARKPRDSWRAISRSAEYCAPHSCPRVDVDDDALAAMKDALNDL